MDAATVSRVARLARLALPAERTTDVAAQLGGILQWVEQLGQVDTQGVTPLASVTDITPPWRTDAVTDGNQQAAILANAPDAAYGCFVVPKVVE